MTRTDILEAYRKFAALYPDRPPGMAQFLRAYPEISQHAFRSGPWRSWGSFQREAGIAPNTKNERLPDHQVFEALAKLARELGRVPTDDDIAFARRNGLAGLSPRAVRNRASTLAERADLLRAFAKDRPEWTDVVAILPTSEHDDVTSAVRAAGFVYLMRDGSRFKIGRTSSVERRHVEASTWITDVKVLHRIATDDPEGVEAYWHRRFREKNIEREWFALDRADVAAFKRWKKIV